MVSEISESRLILLFTEGLAEPLKRLVRDYRPTTLQEAMSRTRYLYDAILSTKYPPKPPMPHKSQNPIPHVRKFLTTGKRYYSYKDWDELRRKKLCFSYQEPWALDHKCVKGKAHYIEVFYESYEEVVEEGEMDDGEY